MKKVIKRVENLTKYQHCYFYTEKYDDGSWGIYFSDPGEGTGW